MSTQHTDRAADKRRIAELEALLAEWERRLTAVMPKDMKCWHQNSVKEWPEVAAWVIENQRKHIDEFWMPRVEYLEKQVSGLEEQLSAAQKPRVMKRWGVDVVPEGQGYYWVSFKAWKKNPIPIVKFLTSEDIAGGYHKSPGIRKTISHWLELEPAPTLPEASADIIARDGENNQPTKQTKQ